jgi:aryl-alcohol dehydrogenase-like predicted oxidoreductase
MRFRRLGDSGLLVSEIGLGTMIFGEASERGVSSKESGRIIDAFLASGGNHFDIADVYAGGRAEEIVGQAVRGLRDQVVITTKVRWPMGDGPNDAGLSRFHIVKAVEASLRRLQTDAVDVLYLHGWDPWTPLSETMATLADLVAAGKVRYVGVSNFKAWQVMKALAISDQRGWPRFVAAQYQYSLVVRDIEPEFSDLLPAEGVGLVPWGPLGGGFLSGKYRKGDRPTNGAGGRIGSTPDEWEESWVRRATARNWTILDEVSAIAARHGATQSQVALSWLLSRASVSSVVVGAKTREQLADNLGALTLLLSSNEIAALDEVSSIPVPYPYRSISTVTR